MDILHKECLRYKQIIVVYFNSTLLSAKLETKIRIYRLDVTHTVFPPYLSCENISSNIISLRNKVSEPKLPPLIQLG